MSEQRITGMRKYVRSVDQWSWRYVLIGPASLVDALLETVTLGFLSPSFGVRASLWALRSHMRLGVTADE